MTQNELLTRTAISSWKQVLGRVDQVLSSTSEEDLQQQVAPGRNRLFYLIGHLTATHDRMFPLLGLGERMHPELDAVFFDNPDNPAVNEVSSAALKSAWSEINQKLTDAFEALRPEQWFERHTAVSPEDFAKDPLRNRLAVLLSRTNHVSFHAGQIRLTR